MKILKNKYILLGILCLLTIIALNITFAPITKNTPASNQEKEIDLEINSAQLTNSPKFQVFIIIAMIYFLFILVGLINIFIFSILCFQKKPILYEITPGKERFSLTYNESAKLMFLVTLFILILHLLSFAIYPFKNNINILNLSVILNLIFELGIIIITLKFMKNSFTKPALSKTEGLAIFQTYTAILPILLLALLVNREFVRILSLQENVNPAIELLLNLKSKPFIFMLLLQAVLIGPIAEELFFRGFLQRLLRVKYSFLISAVICSLIFALIHQTPINVLPLFLISFCLSYIYEKTNNIAVPIAFHSLHNTINTIFLLLIKDFI